MTNGEEQTLASGAKLRIQVAPFADAKSLFQAVMRETQGLKVETVGDVEVLLIKAFAVGFSSPQVEACLWKCFERCTYNGMRIAADTFEPVEARDDYIKVCLEVAKSNIGPFLKSLYASFKAGMQMAESALARSSTPTETTA